MSKTNGFATKKMAACNLNVAMNAKQNKQAENCSQKCM